VHAKRSSPVGKDTCNGRLDPTSERQVRSDALPFTGVIVRVLDEPIAFGAGTATHETDHSATGK
jgi:hypothetical protein